MKIAILDAANVGGALALVLTKVCHEIIIGVRNKEETFN